MQRSLYIIIGLILLAAPLAAQDHPAAYRGSRPASRSELNALETRVEADSARIDSLKYRYGQAGQIISPGFAYYQDTTDGKWYLADSSITVKADGLAKDSLAIDEVGRFQVSGHLTIPWYNYPTPGVDLVSGFTPGSMVVTDASRDSTLKMHRLAESTNDSTTVIVGIAKYFWIWVTP